MIILGVVLAVAVVEVRVSCQMESVFLFFLPYILIKLWLTPDSHDTEVVIVTQNMDRMHDRMSAPYCFIMCSICNFSCALCCSVSSGCVLSHSIVLITPIDVATRETHMAAMVNFPGL